MKKNLKFKIATSFSKNVLEKFSQMKLMVTFLFGDVSAIQVIIRWKWPKT